MCLSCTPLCFTEGGVLEGEDDLLEGDEEGGGWDVDAEDLELPPDLVRRRTVRSIILSPSVTTCCTSEHHHMLYFMKGMPSSLAATP